ncbi:MAG: two-component sensor histidine kinase, partial [Bdellovibrionota bacterium]
MSDYRPDADQLLSAVQKMSSGESRGRLRVFLGMCPGVGKTYAMLKAAHEAQTRGTKVLVGVVETHGRKETEELIKSLSILPPIQIPYKGSILTEMNLDQIIREKPDLVLVDELAHTNAPGSRHIRRYQDVEELLNHGIDVFTTVNIQHIESRNDQVAQITGIKVRETVPDSFFENAGQIEVVDLSPEELLRRLKEGKVYLGERAEQAEQNFFKIEYLTALRELALRFTAERVDHNLKDQMVLKGIEGPWNTQERLLVAVSYSPYSARLIRATARKSYNLEASWVALYVDNGDNLTAEDKETLHKNLNLARELGGEVMAISDNDISRAIQKICREKNITQIIMGRPERRFFQDLFSRGTILDRFVRSTSNIDVHVIRAARKPRYRGFHLNWPEFSPGIWPYWNVLWFFAVISFGCYAVLP